MTPALEEELWSTPELTGMIVVTMPDGLLFDGWQRAGRQWDADALAGHFGDLIRANREGLRALKAWSRDMQVTVESSGKIIVLREISSDFAVGCIFEGLPVGLARMHTKRLAGGMARGLIGVITDLA
jgi:hypothetical protein